MNQSTVNDDNNDADHGSVGSDIEIEGIDMADDESVDEDEDYEPPTTAFVPSKVAITNMATADSVDESAELEAARKEQAELFAAEKRLSTYSTSETAQDRLNYLLSQSDVFAHFLAGSVATNDTGKKKKSSGVDRRGKTGRLTEAEEDAALMKTAQSKRRVVRLNQQPKLLSRGTQMYPYQLEGLNWLIKMHDNGINSILADEVSIFATISLAFP
jgi:SNF2 family DNA or RNA helicase